MVADHPEFAVAGDVGGKLGGFGMDFGVDDKPYIGNRADSQP